MPSNRVEGKVVDSYKFARESGALMRATIPAEPQYQTIPWTPLTKKLSDSRIALLTTAGVSMKSDIPFDMDREREDPLWGDPGFRRIKNGATENEVDINHLHINTEPASRDLNVVLPLQRVQTLAENGEIGDLAPTHYSIMGYNTDPTEQVTTSAVQIAEATGQEEVDVVLMIPV